VTELPSDFLAHIRSLEAAYLAHDDPILQSGFHGGAERWRAEREPILDAIDSDGDLLDVGCANGYLLECLATWGRERGLSLTPHGVDIGPKLIEAAKLRLPEFADNFYVANAWDWRPSRRFRYVYALHDCVPEQMLGEYVQRLLDRVVEPVGRLIAGAYGSRSRGEAPRPIAQALSACGFEVAGTASGGDSSLTEFAWVDRAVDSC